MYEVYISMRHTPLSTYYAGWIEKGLKGLGSGNVRMHSGYDQIRRGEFPKSLLEIIKQCRNFIVILTPDTFRNEDDNTSWFAYEIEAALKAKANIIPVVTPDFVWPEKLPERAEGLQKFLSIVTRGCKGLSSDYIYIKPILKAIEERLISEDKNDVFISYSPKDSLVADEIKQRLEANGISCWAAPQSVPAGASYATEVTKAIENSKIFLTILSENSMTSPRVTNELNLAVLKRLVLMPFQIDTSKLNDEFEYYFYKQQIFYAFNDFQKSCDMLIDAIKERLKDDNSTISPSNSMPEEIASAANENMTINSAKNEGKIYPYAGEKEYIFLSYCHKNTKSVMEIIQRLINDGYRVWYDEGIDPGSEWDDFIAEKIEKSGYFIALISEEYMESDNCKDELKYARDLKKDRLIVYLTEVELTGGLAMRLNRLQAIHKYKYSSFDAFVEKLESTPALDKFID